MITFEITSHAFRGLRLTITAARDGMQDACFATTGNSLPDSMYRRLQADAFDMDEVATEIFDAQLAGDLSC